jgi:hypothetical protein
MADSSLLRSSSFPYIAPFAAFLALLAAGDFLGLGALEFPFRVAVLSLILWFCSRHVISLRATNWLGSILLGIAVFFLWIAPDVLFPGYRSHWLLQNSITGKVSVSIPSGLELSPLVLLFRTIRAAVLVPIIEELFWRAWLMRYLINPDFEKVALGTFQAASFLFSAALFASEHGPYWDVGLLTGLLYNAWMIRTKSLGDCILTHAVTNLALSLYVILYGKWEYWM